MPARKPSPFGSLLRYWRGARKQSQLAVALEAGVSARHLSFLETGRARPSRDMVLLLADVLEVPLRERNALLSAAGFAHAYRETALWDPAMATVRRSIEFLLSRHEPYPAIVVDRRWDVQLMNAAATRVFGAFVDPASLAPPINAMRILFEPGGLRPYIVNWHEFAAIVVQRLHREAMASASDEDAQALLAEALAADGVPEDWRTPDLDAVPSVVAHMRARKGDLDLSLFSAITTLGTAIDITLNELRIETFFPADDATDAALRALADPPGGGS